MVRAVVREWHEDEGWGVVDCAETPGGCWVHFSAIASPEIVRGDDVVLSDYQVLSPGAAVDLAWEKAEQDGFGFRATAVSLVAALPSCE